MFADVFGRPPLMPAGHGNSLLVRGPQMLLSGSADSGPLYHSSLSRMRRGVGVRFLLRSDRATLTGDFGGSMKHRQSLLAAAIGFSLAMLTAGLPSKIGVGGGIVSVVPGKMAIAAFSPRLNEAGNSIRAMRAIRQIAGELGVGLYGPNPD